MRVGLKVGIALAVATGTYFVHESGKGRTTYESVLARTAGPYQLCRAIHMNNYGFASKYALYGKEIESKPTRLYGAMVVGEQPLVVACESSWCDNAFLLLKYGAKVDVVDSSGNTPLHAAAKGNSPRLIQALIDKGADVNALNKDFRTPLDLATMGNTPSGEAALLLIIRGGRLKNPSTYNTTSRDNPLMSKEHSLSAMLNICLNNCSEETIMAFLREGANLSFKLSDRRVSTLGRAIEDERPMSVIEAMLMHGADPNETYQYRSIEMTVMHFACLQGNPSLVKLLIKYGGNPNLKNSNGETPLDMVAHAQEGGQ